MAVRAIVREAAVAATFRALVESVEFLIVCYGHIIQSQAIHFDRGSGCTQGISESLGEDIADSVEDIHGLVGESVGKGLKVPRNSELLHSGLVGYYGLLQLIT